MLKNIGWVLLSLVLCLVAFLAWVWSLIDHSPSGTGLTKTTAEHIPYLQPSLIAVAQPDFKPHGKVLAVVTSTGFYPAAVVEGKTKKTGYELTELSRFYWVLQANGFEVDIASPLGGDAPRVLDDDDMGEFDYAFLNDTSAMHKARNTLRLADISAKEYQAIYFVGGKGAMYDFPDNPEIARLIQAMIADNKPIIAVCHGPAAFLSLAGVSLAGVSMAGVSVAGGAVVGRGLDKTGQPWLQGKKLTAFTNAEELLLIPDAAKRFDGLLQDKLQQQCAEFIEGHRYLPNLVIDGTLITGQNPWSMWLLAEATIQALGVTPISRSQTAEERSMQLMLTYRQQGMEQAVATLPALMAQGRLDRNLAVMMALVAAMAGEWSDIWPMLQLAREIKAAQAHQLQ